MLCKVQDGLNTVYVISKMLMLVMCLCFHGLKLDTQLPPTYPQCCIIIVSYCCYIQSNVHVVQRDRYISNWLIISTKYFVINGDSTLVVRNQAQMKIGVFRRVFKLRQATLSFVTSLHLPTVRLSVLLSVSMDQLSFQWIDCNEIWYS
jgi:hypothetical protein